MQPSSSVGSSSVGVQLNAPVDATIAEILAGEDADPWAFPWQELDLPVLNITGHCDRVFLDREVVDRVTAAMTDVRRLDWQDCGHLVPLERPQRLADALSEFGTELTR